MAAFFVATHFILVTLFYFNFQLLTAHPSNFSFCFNTFDNDTVADIALYGDAKPVSNGSLIQLTNSVNSSSGSIVYRKPIKVIEGRNGKLVSFSTYFSFSMSSSSDGDGLFFVMVANEALFKDLKKEKNSSKVVIVEFGKFVSINLGGVEIEKNVSSINAEFSRGKKLSSWIDYEAGSHSFEVRLSQFGDPKPVDAMLVYPIDSSKLWNDENVFVGLSSSNGNSSQKCLVYSWRFMLRYVPRWMHSQPLDPGGPMATAASTTMTATETAVARKRGECVVRLVGAFIFWITCGMLGAFAVSYLWRILSNVRPVILSEEGSDHALPCKEDYEYMKVECSNCKLVSRGLC